MTSSQINIVTVSSYWPISQYLVLRSLCISAYYAEICIVLYFYYRKFASAALDVSNNLKGNKFYWGVLYNNVGRVCVQRYTAYLWVCFKIAWFLSKVAVTIKCAASFPFQTLNIFFSENLYFEFFSYIYILFFLILTCPKLVE